jgi:hypothetical protein
VFGNSDVACNRFDEQEWKSLGKINDRRSVLKKVTKCLEGSVVSLAKGLPAMDLILTTFEDGRAQYKNDIIMATLYQDGWEKMKKYYNLAAMV